MVHTALYYHCEQGIFSGSCYASGRYQCLVLYYNIRATASVVQEKENAMIAKVSMLDIATRQSMTLTPSRVIQLKPRSCKVWRVSPDGTETRLLTNTTICLTSKTVKIGDIVHLIE